MKRRRQTPKPGRPVDARKSAFERHANLTRPTSEQVLRARLEEAELRYRALAESLPIVTYVSALDVQGAFVYVSPQVYTVLGYQPREWLADRTLWLKRLHPSDRPALLVRAARAHKDGKNFSAEYRLLDRKDFPHWFRDEARVVRNAAGKPLFIQGTLTEISKRKKLEGEVVGKERALASAMSELEQFVSVASHELKAPLRRMGTLGQVLRSRCEGKLESETLSMLDRILDSAAIASDLLAGLVTYADTFQHNATAAVDLDEVLKRARAELSEALAGSKAHLTSEPLGKVWGEPALIERVFVNLIDNAIKFCGDEPPRIHISGRRDGEDLTISVRDDGIGIHGRQAERVFALFDRLNPSADYRGMGLGLAVCRKIIQRFDGRIWVTSEPGEGATFHFTLKAADLGVA